MSTSSLLSSHVSHKEKMLNGVDRDAMRYLPYMFASHPGVTMGYDAALLTKVDV